MTIQCLIDRSTSLGNVSLSTANNLSAKLAINQAGSIQDAQNMWQDTRVSGPIASPYDVKQRFFEFTRDD